MCLIAGLSHCVPDCLSPITQRIELVLAKTLDVA